MKLYEGLFVVDPALGEEDLEKAIGDIEGLVKRNKGEVERTDRWGRKPLAYAIKKKKEGYYVLVNFKAEPSAIRELDRVYRLSERLLRHAIYRR